MSVQASVCDNEVVGALPYNEQGECLILTRVNPPKGKAPPCGHRDKHGLWREAVNAEVSEETGLTVVSAQPLFAEWVPNRCGRRPGPLGIGHNWVGYRVTVTGTLAPNPSEADDVHWAPHEELDALVRRTIDYAWGRLPAADWDDDPGLEPVWGWLLSGTGCYGQAKLFDIDDADRHAMLHLARGHPPATFAPR